MQVKNLLNSRKKLRKIMDPDLTQNSYTLESIAMYANLASRCVRPESSERPSMGECVRELHLISFINSKGLGMAVNKRELI